MVSLVFLFAFSGFLGGCLGAGVVCQDDDGNAVDWYYAYKAPRNDTNANEHIAYGDAYTYLLSSQAGVFEWTLSSLGADSEQSMMGRTLAPIYAQPKSPDLAFVLYNDEDPYGNWTSGDGHSKGILAFDQDGGFWMVQNVPKYPGFSDGPYTYPSSGHMYGQGFLCITINLDQVDNIGRQFQYVVPWAWDYLIPSWAADAFPDLYDAIVDEKQVDSAPWYLTLDVVSNQGVTFTSFAKHVNYGLDVYADLVAPTLQTNLYVETWNHGDDELPSVCAPYVVYNIDAVNIAPLGYVFDNYWDHSKWAVAPLDSLYPWICLGDNNRMASQERRGGFTVCQQSNEAWTVFANTVAAMEPCP